MNGAKNLNRARWQQERERFRIASEEPSPPFREPERLGSVLAGLIGRMDMGEGSWLSVLMGKWETVAGKEVARHTRPGRVDGKRLVVFVESSVWLNEMARYGKKLLLANLKKDFGDKVTSVSFQLDPGR